MGDNKFNVFLMFVIVIIIVSLSILFSTKSFLTNDNINNGTTTEPSVEDENIIRNDIPQNNDKLSIDNEEIKELESIIINELSLAKTKKGLNEITNELRLAVALNKLRATTSQPKNENGQLISFTADELTEAFNNTCLSNLEIKHESIRGVTSIQNVGYPEYSYSYDNGIYTYGGKTNKAYSDFPEIGHKIITAIKENKNYIISVKYMWGNLTDCGVSCVNKAFGKLYDSYDQYLKFENNNIGTLENVNSKTDLTNYFNNNYENQKDNLDTYTYIFNKIDDKFKLINFYIS